MLSYKLKNSVNEEIKTLLEKRVGPEESSEALISPELLQSSFGNMVVMLSLL